MYGCKCSKPALNHSRAVTTVKHSFFLLKDNHIRICNSEVSPDKTAPIVMPNPVVITTKRTLSLIKAGETTFLAWTIRITIVDPMPMPVKKIVAAAWGKLEATSGRMATGMAVSTFTRVM